VKLIKGGVKLIRDQAVAHVEAVEILLRNEILVGFPEQNADREPEDSHLSGPNGPTNAALGYIHDHGAPEANIPARPFMDPGIQSTRDDLAGQFRSLLEKVTHVGGIPPTQVAQRLHRIGLVASVGIKNKINEGIPPPLAESTLLKRANRGLKGRKGAQKELQNRAKGEAPSTQFAKPLVDTGQLRNAVNYVIRPSRPGKVTKLAKPSTKKV